MFKNIESKCRELDLTFCPKEVTVDFESAIYSACTKMWPNVIIKGYRFHLHQSWHRKIQSLHLSSEYKDSNSVIGNYLKVHFGISCLVPADVSDFFNTELHYLMPADSRVQEFRNYLSKNYIHENSKFPQKIWANSGNFLYQTTNACESFHAHFNSSFYKSHPNIFSFVDVLIKLQSEVYIKIRSAKQCGKRTGNIYVQKKCM